MSSEMIGFSAARHPAQHRERVSLIALFYGLFAAPIVWAGNLMVTYALATHACYPGGEPLDRVIGGFDFAWSLILLCYLITLAVCVSAFLASLRSWRVTGSETEGHARQLMEKGEGRTRYLSIIGISFSILFFVITAVGALTTAIVPLCAA